MSLPLFIVVYSPKFIRIKKTYVRKEKTPIIELERKGKKFGVNFI